MILSRKVNDNVVDAIYESSNILASSYDTTTHKLTLIFKGGGSYTYDGVSSADYLRLEIAESQGKVFNSHIKAYPFVKGEKIDASNLLLEIQSLKTPAQSSDTNEASQ